MRDTEMKLAELLNRETLTEEEGKELALNIEDLFNGLGSKAKGIYEGLSAKGKNRMLLCAYLALFDVARWWIANGCDGWDDRKKASAIFAYRNLDFLSERFEETTGLPAMPECPDERYGYFHMMTSGWNQKKYIDSGYEWMLGFMSKWGNAHSTLMQSFIRFMVNEVILPSYPDHKFAGNTSYDGSIAFPFI